MFWLTGVLGSGKTETAHKFCSDVKGKYSLLAEIALSRSVPFIESLENFVTEDLKIDISYGKYKTVTSITRHLEKYLNVKERKGFPFLIVVDNIDCDTVANYKNLVSFVSLIDKISNLDIMLLTKDQNLKGHLKGWNCDEVHFDGMREKEYLSLFALSGYTDGKAIKNLVKVIGDLPIVLTFSIHYMDSAKKTPNGYIEEYCSNQRAIMNVLDMQPGLDKSVIKSQEVPIKFIRNKLTQMHHAHEQNVGTENPKTWKVFTLIPFLRFRNVSTTVLEACYYHLTSCDWDEKKIEVDHLSKTLASVSVCSLTCKTLPRIRLVSQEAKNDSKVMYDRLLQQEKRILELKFHEATMYTLQMLIKEWKEDTNVDKELISLLNMFCYEIDIDARTDITVYRNMQFIRHAKKVLNEIEKKVNRKKSDEEKFYISYLHCAIGSTYLFERTKAEKAHLHLMKARRSALSLLILLDSRKISVHSGRTTKIEKKMILNLM